MSYIFDGANWDLTDPGSIPHLLFAHLDITIISMAIALLIAFPIGLLVARYKRLYIPVLSTAGILYTIPSLAALAFLVPFTKLTQATIIIPLVAYAQVVLIRNIVAAIRAVDPALVEVGRAMGMNTWQVQRRVVLPLALPVIIAGLRVTTVTTIGIATLAPLVGVDDFGTLVFQGFNFARSDLIAAGTILVSALAISADLLLLGAQAFFSRGRQIAAVAR
ncbi:MAG: ABC transporter permease [Ktedonobacterales bacterium]|nr:ABC transporter permease [Ktedonobacterales bacterium]